MSKSAAVFNKKKFINDVTETVRHMYRKQLKEASQQEIFQAVSYVVKDVVIDDWLATALHGFQTVSMEKQCRRDSVSS